MRREFVVAAYIVDDGKILLVDHKKLKMWLPVGGHIEQNELPDDTVIREVKEETGLDVEIISEEYPDFKRARILNRPILVALEDIDSEHQHIDFQYICRVTGSRKLDGTEDCKWFDEEGLKNLENCSEGVKHFAGEAVKYIKSLTR